MKAVTALLALASLAACSHQPLQPVPIPELSARLPGNTLLIQAAPSPYPGPIQAIVPYQSYQTMLYLDPQGSGWADSRLVPGDYPLTSDMRMIIRWYITGGSELCFWSTPRIGEMPSNPPLPKDCVALVRPPHQPGSIAVAEPMLVGRPQLVPITLVTGNAFPAARLAQFDHQVRVLYGGFPVWPLP